MKRIYTDEERKQRKRESYQRWKAANPEKARQNWIKNNEMKTMVGYHAERYKRRKVQDNARSKAYYWAHKEEIAQKARIARAKKKAGLPGIAEEKRIARRKEGLKQTMVIHNIFNRVRKSD